MEAEPFASGRYGFAEGGHGKIWLIQHWRIRPFLLVPPRMDHVIMAEQTIPLDRPIPSLEPHLMSGGLNQGSVIMAPDKRGSVRPSRLDEAVSRDERAHLPTPGELAIDPCPEVGSIGFQQARGASSTRCRGWKAAGQASIKPFTMGGRFAKFSGEKPRIRPSLRVAEPPRTRSPNALRLLHPLRPIKPPFQGWAGTNAAGLCLYHGRA